MAEIGLQTKAESTLILIGALQSLQAAELRSRDRKQYANFLISFTKLIDEAIKNKDIESLFSLEKDAQIYDFNLAEPQEKRRDSLSLLEELYGYWQRCQDPKTVIDKFGNAHDKITQATKPINDPTMSNAVQSQCRKISNIAGANKTFAEDLFYRKRKEALHFIEKEHIKMINEHLGLSQSKGISR